MSGTLLLEGRPMNKVRKDIRWDPAILKRIEKQADRFGIGFPDYVMIAVVRKLEEDEREHCQPGSGPKRKSG